MAVLPRRNVYVSLGMFGVRRPSILIESRARRYNAGMSEHLRFVPPSVEFDPRLANELARREVGLLVADDGMLPIADRHSPLNGYVRLLTPEGGILICYRDQDRSLFLETLRVFAWTVATGLGGWMVFSVSSLSVLQCLLALVLLMFVNWFLVRRPIEVPHSVEIRPDAMIVDGKDAFLAEDIGDNWPELQMKDDDPDRMVIAGICGTRFIEYMTANRLDANDRTPEVLAADLEAAMEQLWGRREITFPTTF
jgi:hypothetical protein